MVDKEGSEDSYKSSWNTALYANEALAEVQDWCTMAAMNRKYRDWVKALSRFRTILRPLMSKGDVDKTTKELSVLRSMASSYRASEEDDLYDSLVELEESLRVFQNECGLGFALDEVQQSFEVDGEGLDKLIKSNEESNRLLREALAAANKGESGVSDE